MTSKKILSNKEIYIPIPLEYYRQGLDDFVSPTLAWRCMFDDTAKVAAIVFSSGGDPETTDKLCKQLDCD